MLVTSAGFFFFPKFSHSVSKPSTINFQGLSYALRLFLFENQAHTLTYSKIQCISLQADLGFLFFISATMKMEICFTVQIDVSLDFFSVVFSCGVMHVFLFLMALQGD